MVCYFTKQQDLLTVMDDTLEFYEGAEKLLVVWFEPLTSGDATNLKWLRTISRYLCVCMHVSCLKISCDSAG